MMSALIGFFIALLAPAPQGSVTFAETVAPILYKECVQCHRPGESGPFSLITYEDARKRGPMIARVTQSRFMPPWHAAENYGQFADERRLTATQITAIAEWVRQGMPGGDARKMPALPTFSEGWQLGKPDLILEMPKGYDVPADGRDVYRNFILPLNLPDDQWVRAIELRSTARRAVHHVLYGFIGAGTAAKVDGADGQPGFFGGMAPIGLQQAFGKSGGLGGWAVGMTPRFLPSGQATQLPRSSDFVLQMHFHPTGKPESERSTVGIYLSDKAPERALFGVEMPALFGFGAGLDIPAGEKNYMIQDSVTLPADIRAFGMAAHAHYVGKELKATATLPDGSIRPLLWIQDWDFNWQDTYTFKEPVILPKGTRIDVSLRYDNSADNPRNPHNPPQRIEWGEQSDDEMGSMTVLYEAVKKEDEAVLQQWTNQRTQAAIMKGVQNGALRRFQSVPNVVRPPK
jgi:hypothetical protein